MIQETNIPLVVLEQPVIRDIPFDNKTSLQELVAQIPLPHANYLPAFRENYEVVTSIGDMKYIAMGAADGYLKVLSTDETFSSFPAYKSKGEKIPAGSTVFAIKDIVPFQQTSRIDDPSAKTYAKLHMTCDFLRLFWKIEEVDLACDTFYGLTNARMANFMIHRWGFRTFRQGDDEILFADPDSDDLFVVQAQRSDIESRYPQLLTYIKKLQTELQEMAEVD